MDKVTTLEKLADYAASERFPALPAEAVHHTKRSVLDWFGSALAGCSLEPATTLERALKSELDHGSAWLISGRRATPRTAALINGTASHILELDDIYRDALYHPGAPVISAALAAAQANGTAGDKFLLGILVGYEVSTRIGVAINPAHYRFWHTTGTVGCIGAATAAASITNCNKKQIGHAIATATTFASGLQQALRSPAMTKPLHAGHAADVGVWSALAAMEGLTGVSEILDGSVGFGAAMSNEPAWGHVVSDLGKRYNITQITFKNHACCGQTFPAVDGILELRKKVPFSVELISRIVIFTTQEAIAMTSNYSPQDSNAAKFSLPYAVASALIHGNLRLSAFSDERIADEPTRALMARVELVVDPDIQAAFPRQRSARILVQMTDGTKFEHFQPTRKGDPDSPLTDLELNEKFVELASPSLGERAAHQIMDEIWNLERSRNLTDICKMIQVAKTKTFRGTIAGLTATVAGLTGWGGI